MDNELKTPNEFSSYYYKKLKEELNVSNINLNKLGFVGFFIDLLGNVQFDVKGYYDHLFNESFPISARETQNLLYHSDVFGYQPALAIPSTLNGELEFDIRALLDNSSGVKLREIEIRNIEFAINQVRFQMNSIYKLYFNYLKPNYFSTSIEIYNDDRYDTDFLKYSNSKVPIVGFSQYESETLTRYLPKYPYGSFSFIDIPLTNYLNNVVISVREKYATEFEIYNIKISKFETTGTEKTIFYKLMPDNTLRLEFGSGIHGNYIPEAEVKIYLQTTLGEKGNIGPAQDRSVKIFSFDIIKYDYDFDDVLIDSKPLNVARNVISNINITGSAGGVDAEIQTNLKQNLIKYIQTRENLVSQTDYNNVLENSFPNSDILFKKSGIVENIIYVYSYFLNNYRQPYFTLTQSILRSEFEKTLSDNKIVYPTFILNDREYVCPFYFEFNELLEVYDGYIFDDDINFYPIKSPFISSLEHIQIKQELFNSVLTFLNLVYFKDEHKTRIFIKNKHFSDDHNLRLTIESLGVNTYITNKIEDSFYVDVPGVIKNPTNITLTLTLDGYNFYFYFNEVQNVIDCNPFLNIKRYKSDKEYVINLPLIDWISFNNNKDAVQSLIKDLYLKANLENNRMVSDDVQVRFSNTTLIESSILKKITKQKFDFRLQFPLKLEIEITLDKNEVLINAISVQDLTNDILLSISKFILDEANGISIKYYNTQVVDICHNFESVKSCKVRTVDSNGNEIISGIESLDKNNFIKLLTKEEYLNYSSIYWWFDINDINITTILI